MFLLFFASSLVAKGATSGGKEGDFAGTRRTLHEFSFHLSHASRADCVLGPFSTIAPSPSLRIVSLRAHAGKDTTTTTHNQNHHSSPHFLLQVAGGTEGTKLQIGDVIKAVGGTSVQVSCNAKIATVLPCGKRRSSNPRVICALSSQGLDLAAVRRLLRGPPRSLVTVDVARGWAEVAIHADIKSVTPSPSPLA